MSGTSTQVQGASGDDGLLLTPPAMRTSVPRRTVQRKPRAGQIPVAFLIDAGVTLMDFVGPLEVFANAPQPQASAFFGFTVAPERKPFASQMGLELVAEFEFDDAPTPRILVIAAQGNWSVEKLAWIRSVAAQADAILSVCTGAFLLAETGLLNGLRATTHHQFHDRLAERYPAVQVVRDGPFVDNGKIITAAGLTSGIDAALHLVDRYFGPDAAREVAEFINWPAAAKPLGQLAAEVPV